MFKSKNTPPAHAYAGSRGFALIITILLMSMLVLIMVSFSALTRVEIQIATNFQQQDVARRNAITALTIALGQLQAAAGPDQRVTATAEILDSDPTTTAVENVNQPHWTGVWKTGSAGLDIPNTGTAQRQTSLGNTSPTLAGKSGKATWLVSKPTATTVVDPITGPTGATVTLASQIGATPTDVKVPLVDLTATVPGTGSTTVGRYAYWVADEGVKAKVNLVDPTLGAATGTTQNQGHFLAPQAHALNKIAGLTTSASTDFRTANTPEQLNKVITLNSLMFLPTTPTSLNLKTYLPDITAYSLGVVADVKNGGLKKDLTAAMETGTEYTKLTTRYGYGNAKYPMLYADASTLTVPYTGATAAPYSTFNATGLPWLNLYAYYNLYKSVLPAAPGMTVATTNGPLGTSGSLTALPYIIKPRVITQVEGNTKIFHDSLVPEMVGARMDIALDSTNIDPITKLPSTKYRLILRYYPQLVLHNPYNCRISAANFQFGKTMGGFTRDDGAANSSISIEVSVGGTKITTEEIPLNQAGNRLFALWNKAGECDTLEPGETRVFGLTGHVSKTGSGMPMMTSIGATSLLKSGLQSPEFSQWCYLPTQLATIPNSSTRSDNGLNSYPGTTNANDLVDVTLKYGTKLLTEGSSLFFYRTYISGTNNNASDFLWPNTFGTSSNRTRVTTGVSVSTPQPAWSSVTIGSLKDNPRILAGFVQRKKGLLPPGGSTYINGGTVTPVFHGNAPLIGAFEGNLSDLWQEYYINQFGTPYTGSSEINLWPTGSKAITYYGNFSAGSGSGTPKNIVLRDIPGQPLISLGQFMHMATGTYSEAQLAPAATWATAYGKRDTGSMFIGGSLCNPFVPTSTNAFNYTAGNTTYTVAELLLDDSYLANDTLFDRFFLSTLPPATLTAPTQEWQDFNDSNNGAKLSDASKRLPNSRIKPYFKNGVAPTMADLRDLDTAAANVLLDGAFNVNSTSVNAWKALLGSLSGQDMQVYKTSTAAAASVDKALLANLIPRFWATSESGQVNQPWEGNRALSDTELTDLATRIVEQVKLRGPFLSMSDFLNRRLGADSALTRMGCLQAAIDNTTINDTIKDSGTAVTLQNGDTGLLINYGSNNNTKVGPAIVGSNLKDGKGNTLNSTVGMPGYLMQQDIVQAFSPAMTVRSDTFVIRTYGEGVNPATGKTQAKAWAEAVVQRVPEFIDPSAPALSSLGAAAALNLLNSNNSNFGRRFKIIGFRWLSTHDL